MNSLTHTFLGNKNYSIFFMDHRILSNFHQTVAFIQRSSVKKVFLNKISSQRIRSIEKVFLKIWQNQQENTFARASFLIKLQASVCSFIKKKALAQVLSCEFCQIFKNTFFIERFRWLVLVILIISIFRTLANI